MCILFTNPKFKSFPRTLEKGVLYITKIEIQKNQFHAKNILFARLRLSFLAKKIYIS